MDLRIDSLCPACFQHTFKDGVCAACGYMPPQDGESSAVLAPFTVLARKYMLGKKLGIGGFGITYVAKDIASSQLCCVKEYFPASLHPSRGEDGRLNIQPQQQDEYEEGMQHFIAEVDMLRELRENFMVVNIYDSFEENGTAYFVMELLRGCNMRTFQKQHTAEQNYALALQMLFFVGSALMEVHRFGFIHGDISPENIFVTTNGDIKIIDFGAARMFAGHSSQHGGKIYLKPNYAPYEQYSSKPLQGPWTDVYALAATFYMMVTGQRMVDAISRSKGQAYTPMYQLSPYVSKDLSAVIDHALKLDYQERYQSMAALLQDLGTVVRDAEMTLDLHALMQSYEPKAEAPHSTEADKDKAREVDAQREIVRHGLFSFGKKRVRRAYLELYVKDRRVPRRWLLPAEREIVMGRSADSYVMLPTDNLISRNHCKLLYHEKERSFVLRDVSKFGTYLSDGQRMTKEKPYTLKENETFYVLSRNYRCKVVIEEV